MSVGVTFNGSMFIIPTNNEVGWGTNLTNYLVAIAAGCLQKTGGSFSLSAEVDFGGSFGVKALYYKSRSANVASAGPVRLANNVDGIYWRDSTNSSNHVLTVDSSDLLTFDGVPLAVGGSGTVQTGTQYQLAYYAANGNTVDGLTLITASRALQSDANGLPVASAVTTAELSYLSGVTSAIQTQLAGKLGTSLTSAHIYLGNGSNVATDTAISGAITISNTGVTTLGSGVVANSNIAVGAAIDLTKLAALSTNIVPISNGAGFLTSSSVTATELSYLSGVTSAIQTQINTKAPSVNPTFTGTIGTPLTGLRVVKTTNVGDLTTGQVNLASTNEVTGTLPVTNGGTGMTTPILKVSRYTGDGTASRNIPHAMGVIPNLIQVYETNFPAGTKIPECWTDQMQSSTPHYSRDFNGTVQTNAILSVDASNVTIGNNSAVNQTGVTYMMFLWAAQ